MRAGGLRDTIVFNVDYFSWCDCGFTNLLGFWEVHIHLPEIGDSDVKRAARVEIHYFCLLLCLHAFCPRSHWEMLLLSPLFGWRLELMFPTSSSGLLVGQP